MNVAELARELAARIAPDALLDAADTAALLKCSERYFKDFYATEPSFPKALRLKTSTGRSHPRWQRADVIRWIASHNTGRPRK